MQTMALSHPPSGPFSHANPPSPFLALGRGTLARTLPDRVTWGPRFLARLGWGGLRPGQAVGPQRGLSAIFPARAAHLPRSHQPARRPARRHSPSSPTARCAPAPSGSRPPWPPQSALQVLGLRRWSSALRPRVPRHQAQPPASDSAPARTLPPPGGAARVGGGAAVRLRHRAAPREPRRAWPLSEAPPPGPALASGSALTCARPLRAVWVTSQVCPGVGVAGSC